MSGGGNHPHVPCGAVTAHMTVHPPPGEENSYIYSILYHTPMHCTVTKRTYIEIVLQGYSIMSCSSNRHLIKGLLFV